MPQTKNTATAPAISPSRMRALKLNRLQSEPSEVPFEPNYTWVDLPEGPHAPAKNEAKVLRRICAQTGLSPEQVREHKVYRKELADAAKARGSKTVVQRLARRVRKQLQSRLGLAPWNPELKVAFVQEWPKHSFRRARRPVETLDADSAYAQSF